MASSPEDLLSSLAQLFRAHGVVGTIDGDWLMLPAPHARIQAEAVSERQHPDAVVVQFDVRMFVGFGRMMIESFAGMGKTRDAAIRNAIEAFAAGTFHVVLHAFFRRDEHGQTEQEEWTIAGTPRSRGPATFLIAIESSPD